MNRSKIYRRLFYLLKAHEFSAEHRKVWATEISQGRTDRLTELSNEELHELINIAQATLPKIHPLELKKKAVLGCWFSIGKLANHLEWLTDGGKINQNKFKDYLHKNAGKDNLDQLNYSQLVGLIQKLQTIKMNYENKFSPTKPR